jgi:hypothetical protein
MNVIDADDVRDEEIISAWVGDPVGFAIRGFTNFVDLRSSCSSVVEVLLMTS